MMLSATFAGDQHCRVVVPARIMVLVVTMLCGVVAVPEPAGAQEAALTGVVRDATDAVLPGVTVTAVHVESGNTFVAISEGDGTFRFGALRAGGYDITAELAGFSTVVRKGIELLVGQRATLADLRMVVSAVQETVTVTGAAPLLDVSTSTLGGNIDRRQMETLPLNGRNWMQLTMLAPGARTNAVTDAPIGQTGGGYQVNLDGQSVTATVASGSTAQPRFSRDAIAEFQLVSSRFDATQGRSIGVQVNAVSKAGTNQFAVTASAYVRHDSLMAKDFVAQRVLPYSNQQLSLTLGGPIRKDKLHFFGYYEGEREPQTFIFSSPFPRFNLPDLSVTQTQHMGGGRIDAELTPNTRLLARGNGWKRKTPVAAPPGAALHPSALQKSDDLSRQFFASVIHTAGKTVNELKGGVSTMRSDRNVFSEASHTAVRLRGYSFGNTSSPIYHHQTTWSARDDLAMYRGKQELRIGGEFLLPISYVYWALIQNGLIDATGGPIPTNVQDLFPVWNDPATWNLAALSPITRAYNQGIGQFEPYCAISSDCRRRKPEFGAWVQDDWKATDRLTLNLGLRWDYAVDNVDQSLIAPPLLLAPRPQEWKNFAPRLGFAYAVTPRTVLRGGSGLYYLGISQGHETYPFELNQILAELEVLNDGRPNFAADPYNLAGGGRLPTFEEAKARPHDLRAMRIGKMPYAYQTSVGFERQLGEWVSVQADYVWIANRRLPSQLEQINANISFDPATGLPFPFTDLTRRPYPQLGRMGVRISNTRANYHGLETAITKRFGHNWQLSGTYTLSGQWSSKTAWILPGCQGPMNGLTLRCDTPFPLAPDYAAEYTLAANDGGGSMLAGDQRHRAVVNAIWALPYAFQVSGLYFYGSGERLFNHYSGDVLNTRGANFNLTRTLPDGSVIPRASFIGKPLHRVDLRAQRRFPLGGRAGLDGIVEVFNVFNHVNYGSYVVDKANRFYGQPIQSQQVEYRPRMLQIGFRLAF